MNNPFFKCPICNEEVEIRNEHLLRDSDPLRIDEIGLKNKAYHMRRHKEIKVLEKKKAMLLEKIRKIDLILN